MDTNALGLLLIALVVALYLKGDVLLQVVTPHWTANFAAKDRKSVRKARKPKHRALPPKRRDTDDDQRPAA
jgi:hypothetical protein